MLITSDSRTPLELAIRDKIAELRQSPDREAVLKFLTGSGLSPKQIQDVLYDPVYKLRCNQWCDLSDEATYHIFLAGRGFGKSFSLASTLHRAVHKHGVKDILILARTSRDIDSTIYDAVSGLYHPNDPRLPEYKKQAKVFEYPCGAVTKCIAAESGEDAVRGQNNGLVLADEASFYGNNEGILTQADFTLRREPSKFIVFTTPSASPWLIEKYNAYKAGDPSVKFYRGSTYDNAANLTKQFLNSVVTKYQGTRLGRAELDGELILTNAGALISPDEISYVQQHEVRQLTHIALGVDTALLSKNNKSGRTPDKTSICVAGVDDANTVYGLYNVTGSFSQREWVSKVCDIMDGYLSAGIKVSLNIESNLFGQEVLVGFFSEVGRIDLTRFLTCSFSSDSKLARFSPYALMMQQGRLMIVKNESNDKLVDELISYDGTGQSPNRMDAFVLACNVLQPVTRQRTVVKTF